MNASRRATLTGGLVLILLGLVFLSLQVLPGVWSWVDLASWPLIVVGVGVLLLVIGLLAGAPGMAVPACIVGGIGGLLLWQNANANWETWAWAWTLIPGFAGIGVIVMGLWSGKWHEVTDGAWTMLVSLILFVIFSSFLGGPVSLGQYWPIMVIVLGLISLIRYFLQPRKSKEG